MPLALVAVALARPGWARPGDWCEPIVVDRTPFVHASSSVERLDALTPSALPGEEAVDGRELVYLVAVQVPSLLRTELSTPPDCRGQVAVLDEAPPPYARLRSVASRATAARRLEQPVEPGLVTLVVELAPATASCALRLRLDLEPLGAWYARPVAEGVLLRTWRGADPAGAPRFAAALDVDTAAPGVTLRPLPADGCLPTSRLARQAGAVAALNGGFFGGPRCRSASLLQLDGVALAYNSRDRSALGLTDGGGLQFQRVAAQRAWPGVRHALGGVPRLVRDGAVDVTWQEEHARSDFALQPHPRSAVASTARGALLLAVDGRSPVGAGMTLDALARFLVEQGAQDALNLDGGGSTTLWVAGEPGGGIVNHPSDGALLDATAGQERPVGSALGVFAPPRPGSLAWYSAPLRPRVAVGRSWSYEALAISDRGAAVELALETAPDAAGARLTPRGDGTARVELTPAPGSPPVLQLQLVARAPGHPPVVQDLVVAVVHEFDPPPVDATMRP